MITADHRAALAADLWRAATTQSPIPPIATHLPEMELGDAYAIQQINIARHTDAGARIVGHKLGLTSPVMQHMMGVNTPDFGHLLDTMMFDAREPVSLDAFIQPRVELELAFVLARPLSGADTTTEDVINATDHVVACLELIDSRIEDWKIGLLDTVADNASSAGVLLGAERFVADHPLVAACPAQLEINGVEVAAGSSADVIGTPAGAVAWLVRQFAEFGTALDAGSVVLSGSCTRAIDVAAGDNVVGRFAGLGSITVQFEGKGHS